MYDAVAQNITKVKERIRLACVICDRDPATISLIAVSKTRAAGAIRAAHAAGCSAIGENYLQEALPKQRALADLDLSWHFIGPIQSNKCRDIASHFDWVHSVDRVKVARRLSEARPPTRGPLQVCLQINVSGEASKSGVDPAALPELAAAVASLPNLALRGLMAIPAPSDDPVVQRHGFSLVRQSLESLRDTLPDLDTLSMGMSSDLESAILEGATLVRIGSDIFGPRER
jgi:pyridoxal phosphate enzyme (YggS family)